MEDFFNGALEATFLNYYCAHFEKCSCTLLISNCFRLWWIFCFILSMILCGLMTYEIFNKYFTYPIVITFSMTETRIQQIHFPAVTICPRAKISASYFNVTEMIFKQYYYGTLNCEE